VVFNLVCLAWVFFREPSLREAFGFLRALGTWGWTPVYAMSIRFLIVTALMLFVVDLINESRGEEYLLQTSPHARRVALGAGLMVVVTLFAANQLNAFIYFRF
jgi:alginate O-acetyltransferase complex protein AlgI